MQQTLSTALWINQEYFLPTAQGAELDLSRKASSHLLGPGKSYLQAPTGLKRQGIAKVTVTKRLKRQVIAKVTVTTGLKRQVILTLQNNLD